MTARGRAANRRRMPARASPSPAEPGAPRPGPVRFPTRKVAALLAYLAYHDDREHPREVLGELLWPDAAPEVGRRNLRVALSMLRHAVDVPPAPGASLLVVDR